MSKLDGVFCNHECDIAFSDHILHALSSSLSDHCTLLFASARGPRKPRSFKFENYWVKLPSFNEVVASSWAEPIAHSEPCHVLYHKLARAAKSLRRWGRSFSSNAKLQLHMALEVILRLDEAQDFRPLSPEESDIRKRLKQRVVSLAAIERSRKRQCAHMRNLKDGDANTKYFHMKINARRRKNFILRIKSGPGWLTKHEDMEHTIHSHFISAMRKGP